MVDESKTLWEGEQTNKNFDSYFHQDNTVSELNIPKTEYVQVDQE